MKEGSINLSLNIEGQALKMEDNRYPLNGK
jgi:hypothetical protein